MLGPEVPGHVSALKSRNWASLLGMDEFWELYGISDEEYWGVVSNHIVVSFFSVELNSKSSWISFGISTTSLTSDGRESEEGWSFLSDSVKERSLGVLAHVISDFEDSMCSSTFSMDDSFWDLFSRFFSKYVSYLSKAANLSIKWKS